MRNRQIVTYAYNSSVHEITKTSPFSVVFETLPPKLFDRFHATEGLIKDRTTWGEKMRKKHDLLLNYLQAQQDVKAMEILQKEANFFQSFAVGDLSG
jgi:hypothetical protein